VIIQGKKSRDIPAAAAPPPPPPPATKQDTKTSSADVWPSYLTAPAASGTAAAAAAAAAAARALGSTALCVQRSCGAGPVASPVGHQQSPASPASPSSTSACAAALTPTCTLQLATCKVTAVASVSACAATRNHQSTCDTHADADADTAYHHSQSHHQPNVASPASLDGASAPCCIIATTATTATTASFHRDVSCLARHTQPSWPILTDPCLHENLLA
jgi:hypothetical protein